MKSIKNGLNKLDNMITYISAGTIFLMMLWIICDVLFRTFFNSPIPGTIEITGEYFLVIIVYLSISATYKLDGHVRVEILDKRLSNSLKKYLKLITNLIAITSFIFLGIANFQKGLEYISIDVRTSSGLNYPLAPALMLITLGVALIIITLCLELISIFRKNTSFETAKDNKFTKEEDNTK